MKLKGDIIILKQLTVKPNCIYSFLKTNPLLSYDLNLTDENLIVKSHKNFLKTALDKKKNVEHLAFY